MSRNNFNSHELSTYVDKDTARLLHKYSVTSGKSISVIVRDYVIEGIIRDKLHIKFQSKTHTPDEFEATHKRRKFAGRKKKA